MQNLFATKYWFVLSALAVIILGAGCASSDSVPPVSDEPVLVEPSTPITKPEVTPEVEPAEGETMVVAPVADYAVRRTVKPFGTYAQDRFVGYHAADDIEYTDVAGDVSVRAVMAGEVVRAQFVSGYGGFVLIDHGDVRALYGHLDLKSVTVKPGDQVTAGQTLGILGDGNTSETDGERKHLHFGVYAGDEVRLQGYEGAQAALDDWLNPTEWLQSQGVSL